jgi:hypothetical protein
LQPLFKKINSKNRPPCIAMQHTKLKHKIDMVSKPKTGSISMSKEQNTFSGH